MGCRCLLFFASFLFCLHLVFLPCRAFAQDKIFYSLQESILEALDKNWSLKATEKRIDQAVYSKNRARAEFFPKLSTTYGYTRDGEPTTLIGPYETASSEDNYQWRNTVSQPLFAGFALVSSYTLAKLGIDQSTMELELEKLDITLKAKINYFTILDSGKKLDVSKETVKSLKSHVNVARSFYNAGISSKNDFLKAEVELSNAQHVLVKAQNNSLLARASFNILLSRPVNSPVQVEDILIYNALHGNIDDYLEKAFSTRPEMKLLNINILQADQQIKLAKSGMYPEINLTYNYTKEGDRSDVSGSLYHDANRWDASVIFSWTFWEWGKTYYSISEKQSFKKELINTKLALKDRIQFELIDALLALDKAEKNIPITQKSVEQAKENLRITREYYKAQVTTSTEVLDAQALLTQAETNYYNALYVHNIANAQLLRAIGTF